MDSVLSCHIGDCDSMIDAFNSHRKLEAMSRAIYNLDTFSPRYWSMLFTLSKSLFALCREMNMTTEKNDSDLLNRIHSFLRIFTVNKYGKIYIPSLYDIEEKLVRMYDTDHVIVLRDRSYSFGTRTREISKGQILQELAKIQEWIYEKVSLLPIKYTQPNLNVDI